MRTSKMAGRCVVASLFASTLVWIAAGTSVGATVPPDDGSTTTVVTDSTVPVAAPTALGPLIQSPPGCVVPEPALAVFRGRLINIDDPPTTAQFRVLSMLAGSLEGHASVNRVLIVYGREASFLKMGVEYIVGVHLDLDSNRLVSKILRPAPLFGGDSVIGLDDTELSCPRIEDPISTLLADGSSVDSGVLTPLQDSSQKLMMAVLQPLMIALAVLIGLAMVKNLLVSMGRSLRESTGSAIPLARVRHHSRLPTAKSTARSTAKSTAKSHAGEQRSP